MDLHVQFNDTYFINYCIFHLYVYINYNITILYVNSCSILLDYHSDSRHFSNKQLTIFYRNTDVNTGSGKYDQKY